MNWIRRKKGIRHFSKLGDFFHHVHVRSGKIIAASLVALLMSLKPSFAGTDSEKVFNQYLSVVDSLRTKGITNLSGSKEFVKKSNAFVRSLKIAVKQLIAEEKFPESLGFLAAMEELGQNYGDSSLVESAKVMTEEVTVAQRIYHQRRAPHMLRRMFRDKDLESLGDIKIEGNGWNFEISSGKMGVTVILTKRLIDGEIPIKVTRGEVKEAIQGNKKSSGLDRNLKEALEERITEGLRMQGFFEG
ncbi:hypothetical protein KY345_03020 [Candidatus Woesearchaeota archaeon]|nr:hypothetical protein [Candidatus Woesearchaeota archaeon]